MAGGALAALVRGLATARGSYLSGQREGEAAGTAVNAAAEDRREKLSALEASIAHNQATEREADDRNATDRSRLDEERRAHDAEAAARARDANIREEGVHAQVERTRVLNAGAQHNLPEYQAYMQLSDAYVKAGFSPTAAGGLAKLRLGGTPSKYETYQIQQELDPTTGGPKKHTATAPSAPTAPAPKAAPAAPAHAGTRSLPPIPRANATYTAPAGSGFFTPFGADVNDDEQNQ